jgi:hypothetical protein
MAIVKNVRINIKGKESKTEKDLYFYQNDTGITLEITIANVEVSISKVYSFFSLDEFSIVDILISKPNKKTECLREIPVVNGVIKFDINKSLTDIVGDYEFQIRLLGGVDSKMHIPPCKYTVLEPIAIYD